MCEVKTGAFSTTDSLIFALTLATGYVMESSLCPDNDSFWGVAQCDSYYHSTSLVVFSAHANRKRSLRLTSLFTSRYLEIARPIVLEEEKRHVEKRKSS